MEWYHYFLIVLVGLFAGFLNTLAGSGSIISLSMLMFLGLPANLANGTNRIAILMQNIVGVSSFKKQKIFTFKEGIWLAIPAIAGSIAGAAFAVEMNEEIMEKTIGGLLAFLFIIILYKPNAWLTENSTLIRTKPNLLQIIIFFCIGFYGGFIQVGVGFFLLAGLVLSCGFDLIKANAIKLLIVLFYTPFALGVFILNNQVDYKIGFTLAAGNMLGAYIAANFALSLGAKFIRYLLLGVIVFASLKFLGIYEYLYQKMIA